jgi:DNA-binding beta-propeller fold protein YncE
VVTDTSGNTSLVLDTQLENTFVKEYPATFDFSTTGTNITISFTDEDKTYTRKVDFTQTELLPISNISNGYF